MTVAVKNVLYTAEVVVEGGRDGHARAAMGASAVELDTPSELEGSGGPGTNPEQLFAAAYSACFQSALEGIARGRNLDVSGCKITARVGVGPVADGGFGLEVRLELDAPSLSDEDAAADHDARPQALPLLARDRRQRPCRACRERLDDPTSRAAPAPRRSRPTYRHRGARARRPVRAPRELRAGRAASTRRDHRAARRARGPARARMRAGARARRRTGTPRSERHHVRCGVAATVPGVTPG